MSSYNLLLIDSRIPDIEKLLQSEWWEYEINDIRALPTNNIFEFVKEIYKLKNIYNYSTLTLK